MSFHCDRTSASSLPVPIRSTALHPEIFEVVLRGNLQFPLRAFATPRGGGRLPRRRPSSWSSPPRGTVTSAHRRSPTSLLLPYPLVHHRLSRPIGMSSSQDELFTRSRLLPPLQPGGSLRRRQVIVPVESGYCFVGWDRGGVLG